MTSWQGRSAVITGAASGIGRATAERLLLAGAHVVAADLAEEALGWTEGLDRIQSLAGDVTSEAFNLSLVELAREFAGGLDVLVLNAGLPVVGGLENVSLEEFDRGLDVNLKAVVLGLRAALPSLRDAESPSVVVTASISGLAGDPGLWVYNAAKAGVLNFVRSAALELASDGIRINAVCPGPIHTGMTEGIRQMPEIHSAIESHIPLGRWGEPGEVAAVIEFLASPEASFVTGAMLPVDGGVMANTGQFNPPG